MRKIILITTLLLIAFIGKAQTINGVPVKDIDVDYMAIVSVNKFMSTKVNVRLEFGQRTKMFAQKKTAYLLDENGKTITFLSHIDAINYFSQHGYSVHSTYAVAVGNTAHHYALLINDRRSKLKYAE
jgi:hypothetical protein